MIGKGNIHKEYTSDHKLHAHWWKNQKFSFFMYITLLVKPMMTMMMVDLDNK